MTRTLTIAAIGVSLCTCYAPTATAQQLQWTNKGFFNVNLGGQMPSQTLTAVTTPEIYGEQARFASAQDVGSGLFFEIAAGYKVWRNLTVGAGFTRVGSSDDLTVDAEIPDPVFFDAHRNITFTLPDAGHSQVAINLTGTWMMPVTDKVDVGFLFGPTIFFVGQDLPGETQVAEPGPTVVSSELISEEKGGFGIHFGVDVTYLVTPRIGVGGLARYTWGSSDIAGAEESLTVGGFQIGGGLRYRF